jgi:hypothetical protein
MNNNPQVSPVDIQLPAHNVFVFFIEKQPAQQHPILFQHLIQNFRHDFLSLPGYQLSFRARASIHGLWSGRRNLVMTGMGAKELEGNVMTHGVDKAGQAGGIIQSFSGTKIIKNPQERFLTGVLYQFGGPQAGTQLQLNGPGEVGNKEILGVRVSISQGAKILLVEQWAGTPLQAGYTRRDPDRLAPA